MTTPAEDFAAAISPLLPRRPDPPADDLTVPSGSSVGTGPVDEPVPDDVVDELRRLDADYALTGQLPDGWTDPTTTVEPDGPRRPRPDKSQASGAFSTPPDEDPAAAFARIITGAIPSGPNPYPSYDPRSTSR